MRPTRRVQVGLICSRAPVSVSLSCHRPGALCMFGQPIFRFLPCGIVRSGASCRAMRGRPIGRVRVGSFRSKAPVSVLLGCDRLGALCTFGRPAFSFLPCGIIRSGAPCRDVRGRPTGRVWVGLFRWRAPVWVFLGCDRPGALCMFGWPVFRLLPYGIVRSGALCCAV